MGRTTTGGERNAWRLPGRRLPPARPLFRILRERDRELSRHSEGVARLAVATGRRFFFCEAEIDTLREAGCLHDIGKLAIPRSILDKPSPLDEEEWRVMRRHPAIGAEMLLERSGMKATARLVRSAHERFDGTGYPDGLAGEEIPLGSRVIFAADAYDAMVSARPYRPAMTPAEAIAEMRRYSRSQFDPVVVELLCDVLEHESAVV